MPSAVDRSRQQPGKWGESKAFLTVAWGVGVEPPSTRKAACWTGLVTPTSLTIDSFQTSPLQVEIDRGWLRGMRKRRPTGTQLAAELHSLLHPPPPSTSGVRCLGLDKDPEREGGVRGSKRETRCGSLSKRNNKKRHRKRRVKKNPRLFDTAPIYKQTSPKKTLPWCSCVWDSSN